MTAIRVIITLIFTSATLVASLFYIYFVIGNKLIYKSVFWYILSALFFVILFINLYTMNIFVHRRIGNWLAEKTTKNAKNVPDFDERYLELSQRLTETDSAEHVSNMVKEAPKDSLGITAWVHMILVISNYAVRTVWLWTLVIIAFQAGFMLSRFIESTITNLLINPENIVSYSFFFSVFGVCFKFLFDVEVPYMKLKQMIASNRSAMSMERIVPYREWMKTLTYEEIRDDMLCNTGYYAFFFPMTWTVFFRISKLMRLTRITYRSIGILGVTIFILSVFYFTSQIYNIQFSKLGGGNNALLAIITGTIMPLIPQALSFFSSNEAQLDSPVCNARLLCALKMLEVKEERRNTIPFKFGSIPHKWIYFKYTLLSAMKEDPKEKMDPKYVYTKFSNEVTIEEEPAENST
jgi:hypothetical protein